MSWRACFLDGPLAGTEHDRRFATDDVPQRLWLAQLPDENGRIRENVWSVVGRLPGNGPPIDSWPDQVDYVLDPDLSDFDPAGGEAFGVFRLVG